MAKTITWNLEMTYTRFKTQNKTHTRYKRNKIAKQNKQTLKQSDILYTIQSKRYTCAESK